MNFCRILATKCDRCLLARSMFSHQTYKMRLPFLNKSWQDSQVSFTSRYLHIKKGSSMNTISRKQKMDKVPPEFSAVYQSSVGQWFLMFRVGMGMVCGTLAVVYYMLFPELSKEFVFTDKGLVLLGTTGFFIFFISTFSLAARQFLTRIYHHPDSGRFIGVQRNIFGKLKQLRYTVKDVKPILTKKKKGPEAWESINVNIKGQKVYLQSRDFFSPTYYNMHFGSTSDAPDIMMREPKF